MRLFSIIVSCMISCILAGCARIGSSSFSTLVNEPGTIVTPEVIGGRGKTDTLVEPSNPLATFKYKSLNRDTTSTLPVVLDMHDSNTIFTVTGKNILGSPVGKGSFKGAEIFEREFRKTVELNFHIADKNEMPIAKIDIRVRKISAIISSGDNAKVSMSINVDIKKIDDSAYAYSKDFSASCEKEWQSRKQIPSAFYDAVSEILNAFWKDWDSSWGISTLVN